MLYSIYAESTPNPEVMKFVSNRMLADKSIEISSMIEAKDISIAEALLKFPFVKSIYLHSNFISISKTKTVEWGDIAIQLRIFIADFLNDQGIKNYTENIKEIEKKETSIAASKKEFSDEELEIEALLDQYIKPAVESDGGEIALKSLKENIVTVKLKGACSGCPSASMTLKGGIETLLKQKFNSDIVVKTDEE